MTLLTRIKQKVRSGNYVISSHCVDALRDEGFTRADAVSAILNARQFDKLTGDESHIRYVLFGHAKDGRALDIVVLIHQGTVILKTAYESLS